MDRFRGDKERVGTIDGRLSDRTVNRMSTLGHSLMFVFTALVGTQRYVMRIYDVYGSHLMYFLCTVVFNFHVQGDSCGSLQLRVAYGIGYSKRFKENVPALSTVNTFGRENMFYRVSFFRLIYGLFSHRLAIRMETFRVWTRCQTVKFNRRFFACVCDFTCFKRQEEEGYQRGTNNAILRIYDCHHARDLFNAFYGVISSPAVNVRAGGTKGGVRSSNVRRVNASRHRITVDCFRGFSVSRRREAFIRPALQDGCTSVSGLDRRSGL